MRKIIILVSFLVAFLGTKAQVNPESFPLVTPLGTDNVYSQTGGVTKKFTLKSILDLQDGIDTISVTYADFYNAITNNQLIGGMTYVITDFQTVYDQMDFDAGGSLKPTLVTKTGATEQIWVLALSSNQIADKAYSATYPKDEIQYDWTYNTTLVNGSPAKGRISERIDENNNRTDYDHREIKFIRYDDGAGNFTVINDNGNASQEFLTFVQNFTGGVVKDNWLGDYYSIGTIIDNKEYSNNVFLGNFVVSNKVSSFSNNNTITGEIHLFSITGEFINNIINGGSRVIISGTFNNNVSSSISSSSFSGSVSNNTFTYTGALQYITIADDLQNKTIDDITYPFLFNTYYKKEILQASNGSNYIRYFDGTTDVNTLIP